MNVVWSGEGLDEVVTWDNQCIVKVDQEYFRPTEVDTLLGDSLKARKILGWEPKIDFSKLVSDMIENDLLIAKREELLLNHGLERK